MIKYFSLRIIKDKIFWIVFGIFLFSHIVAMACIPDRIRTGDHGDMGRAIFVEPMIMVILFSIFFGVYFMARFFHQDKSNGMINFEIENGKSKKYILFMRLIIISITNVICSLLFYVITIIIVSASSTMKQDFLAGYAATILSLVVVSYLLMILIMVFSLIIAFNIGSIFGIVISLLFVVSSFLAPGILATSNIGVAQTLTSTEMVPTLYKSVQNNEALNHLLDIDNQDHLDSENSSQSISEDNPYLDDFEDEAFYQDHNINQTKISKFEYDNLFSFIKPLHELIKNNGLDSQTEAISYDQLLDKLESDYNSSSLRENFNNINFAEFKDEINSFITYQNDLFNFNKPFSVDRARETVEILQEHPSMSDAEYEIDLAFSHVSYMLHFGYTQHAYSVLKVSGEVYGPTFGVGSIYNLIRFSHASKSFSSLKNAYIANPLMWISDFLYGTNAKSEYYRDINLSSGLPVAYYHTVKAIGSTADLDHDNGLTYRAYKTFEVSGTKTYTGYWYELIAFLVLSIILTLVVFPCFKVFSREVK